MKRTFEAITVRRRNVNALIPGAIVVMIALSLGGCGKPLQQGSNNPGSNEDAQASLEIRLKKTEEVRVQLNSVRDALRPLDSVLTDVSNALNAKVTIDGKPSDRFRSVIERLREVLKESTKSIVQYNPDGSWVIERNVSLPLGREDYACRTSQIQILGHRVDDHDELNVSLMDCASPERLSLIDVEVHSDRIDVIFYPETLDKLIKPNIKIGQCSVRIRKNETEVHCEPIEIRADAFTAVIDPLDFSHNSSGTYADIKMVVRDRSQKFIASIELEAHPGMQTRIDIRTKEDTAGGANPEIN